MSGLGETRAPSGRVVKAAEMTLRDDIEALRAAAEDARAQAEREADGIRAAARDQGRREGLAAAAEAGAQIIAGAQARAQRVIDELAGALAGATADAAEEIMGQPTDPDVAARAVGAALARTQRHRRLRLFVWPEAAEQVRRLAEQAIAGRTDGAELISVEPDPRLAPGRVLVSSEHGYVEIGPAQQLDVARSVLERAYSLQIERLIAMEEGSAQPADGATPGSTEMEGAPAG